MIDHSVESIFKGLPCGNEYRLTEHVLQQTCAGTCRHSRGSFHFLATVAKHNTLCVARWNMQSLAIPYMGAEWSVRSRRIRCQECMCHSNTRKHDILPVPTGWGLIAGLSTWRRFRCDCLANRPAVDTLQPMNQAPCLSGNVHEPCRIVCEVCLIEGSWKPMTRARGECPWSNLATIVPKLTIAIMSLQSDRHPRHVLRSVSAHLPTLPSDQAHDELLHNVVSQLLIVKRMSKQLLHTKEMTT